MAYIAKLFLICILLFSSSGCLTRNLPQPPEKLKNRLSSTAFNALHSPQIVYYSSDPTDPYQPLDAKAVHELQEILLNDSSYIFDKSKKALFIPEMSLKFINHKEVTVLVSPSSNQIKIITEERNIMLDFDPSAPMLHQLFHDLREFQNNSQI